MDFAALAPFANEPYTDFTVAANRDAQRAAVSALRPLLGTDYPNWIAGRPSATGSWIESTNPSQPTELIGRISRATPADAADAIADAHAYFEAEWRFTPPAERAALLLRTAALLRDRKLEWNGWLILEAGKSFAEAEAETAEAIDFCEYYARQMLRFAQPEPPIQWPGERNTLAYLPLGAGAVISPWNFPLAILAGMTVAALVAGNTVVLKPSSETPVLAARFAAALREAGLPPRALALCAGSGAEIGDALVTHSLTRFVSFTGSRDVGLRINELAARPAPGLRWIRRVVAEMGGKDAIIVDSSAPLESAVTGVLASAFGYQGQKCSACSRAIVVDAVYDEFVAQIAAAAAKLRVGPAEDPEFAMGPVISARARRGIEEYIAAGEAEGRRVAGGDPPKGGHFLRPWIFADIPREARVFREEIFGPVLAITRARDFSHALELANDSDYGLTGAVYSQDSEHLELARQRFHVGNLYLNRKCTGAMVGVHPFGGFNLSGTDSKAGGPDYLLQFLQAQSIAEKLP